MAATTASPSSAFDVARAVHSGFTTASKDLQVITFSAFGTIKVL